MLRLTTFGVPQVHRDGELVGGSASQRRVLALLSLLAAAGARGISRDSVLGILWSDADPEKARQALTQSMYHARRALHQDDLIEAGAELRLNPLVISSDMADFEEALEQEQLERAVNLHVAPFLSGFYVTGASEFERWTTDTRARLAHRCRDACERLAVTSESRADYAAAVHWWKQLAGLDPLNSRITMRLMTALATGGDRAGAIHYARIHETLLREEIEVEPDEAFVALVDQLHVNTAWIPTVATPGDRTASTNAPSIESGTLISEHSARRPAPVVGAQTTTPSRYPALARFRRVRAGLLAGAGMLIVVAIVSVVSWRRASVAKSPDLVVVAPFRISGAEPSLSYLREGLVDLLVTKLTDDATTRAADAGAVMNAWRRAGLSDGMDVPRADAFKLARRFGARRLILGSVVGNTQRMVLSASAIDIEGGKLRAQASVEGRPEELTTLVDELVTRLLAKEAGAWERLVNRTSTSSQALRAYLDGQAAYRRGRYRDAIGAFRRALEIDSLFAMAGLGLANAAERINATTDRAGGVAVAWAAQHELIERDRVFLTALAGPRYPGRSSEREMLSAWERASAIVPDRADIWHELGERLFFDGQILGIPDWAGRSAAAFQRAADLDPVLASPLQYLVRLAADAGDTAMVRHFTRQYLRLDSIGDLAAYVRWRSAVALADSQLHRSVRSQLMAMPAASLRTVALWAQYNGSQLADAERAIAVLRSRAVRDVERNEADHALYALLVNRGEFARAAQVFEHLDNTLSLEAAEADRLRALVAIYAGSVPTDAVRAVARLERHAMYDDEVADARKTHGTPGAGVEARCVVAQWHAWFPVADVDGASLSRGRESRRLPDVGGMPLCAVLIDAIEAVRNRHSDARLFVQRADSIIAFGPPLGSMRGYANLAVAYLYAQLGDSVSARIAVARRPHMEEWPYYLAAQVLLEGRLASAAGDSTAAARSYRHFLRLRQPKLTGLGGDVHELEAAIARLGQEP